MLVSDPSLARAIEALNYAPTGMQRKLTRSMHMTRPLTMFAATVEKVAAGQPATFSWRELVARKARAERPAPVHRDQPGPRFHGARAGRSRDRRDPQDVADLKLASDYGARVRLTGPVPIQDEEFGTLKENAGLNAIVSLVLPDR